MGEKKQSLYCTVLSSLRRALEAGSLGLWKNQIQRAVFRFCQKVGHCWVGIGYPQTLADALALRKKGLSSSWEATNQSNHPSLLPRRFVPFAPLRATQSLPDGMVLGSRVSLSPPPPASASKPSHGHIGRKESPRVEKLKIWLPQVAQQSQSLTITHDNLSSFTLPPVFPVPMGGRGSHMTYSVPFFWPIHGSIVREGDLKNSA